MWHANGTTGKERLGAGGEVEALRPPARSPLFAGASNRHHLPTVGRPAPLFLPGRIAEPVLAPGAIADSMPDVKRRLPYPPLKRGNGAGPGGWGPHPYQGSAPSLFPQDRACNLRERPTGGDNWRPLRTARLQWGVDQTWTKSSALGQRGDSEGWLRGSPHETWRYLQSMFVHWAGLPLAAAWLPPPSMTPGTASMPRS